MFDTFYKKLFISRVISVNEQRVMVEEERVMYRMWYGREMAVDQVMIE